MYEADFKFDFKFPVVMEKLGAKDVIIDKLLQSSISSSKLKARTVVGLDNVLYLSSLLV